MNGLRFTLRMAQREARSTRRRLLLYASSIAAGVAALVAIESFRASVDASVREQSRTLMGADLELWSRSPFAHALEPVIDDLERGDVPASYVTRFSSMALAEPSGRTRLVWVQAVDRSFPFHGRIETQPPAPWPLPDNTPVAVVDSAALIQLDVSIGDRLRIGDVAFEIIATVVKAPGNAGMSEAIAPRVFIASSYLDDTKLLGLGSLARYSAYFRSDDPQRIVDTLERHDAVLREQRVRTETVDEYADELSEDLGRLTRFLGLVGLISLLLGGVGVATGIHVFVSEKLESAAVLRCLGGRQRQVFGIYLAQAAVLGLCGSLLGVALGLGVQATLPSLARDLLPLQVEVQVSWTAIFSGVLLGCWVTLLFALYPLLRIRGVAPLRALRRELEAARSPATDSWRVALSIAGVISLAAVSIWQAPSIRIGLYFAGGLLASLVLLSIAASALMRITRRALPRGAPYWLRQGVANLFRPHNQTHAVTLSLGFGVLLLAALHVAREDILHQLDLARGPDRPNVAIFDIQQDQRPGVEVLLERHGARILEQTPIVPARITRVAGRRVTTTPTASPEQGGRAWALRREYRLTYRDSLSDSERLTEGRWWSEVPRESQEPHRVSLEANLAADLGVEIGDRITWEIQGIPVESEVANFREVDWARFRTNFFAVFEPGALERAPQSYVVLLQVEDAEQRARLQRDLVVAFPNVSVIDATLILQSLDTLLTRVALAIRFMALFAIASGVLILVGSLATSRYQRARESVLLRTLGARAGLIRRILATEYFALGALAGLVGVALACLASLIIVQMLFESTPELPFFDLTLICVSSAIVTTLIGLSYGRSTLRRTPLAGMREIVGPQ